MGSKYKKNSNKQAVVSDQDVRPTEGSSYENQSRWSIGNSEAINLSSVPVEKKIAARIIDVLRAYAEIIVAIGAIAGCVYWVAKLDFKISASESRLNDHQGELSRIDGRLDNLEKSDVKTDRDIEYIKEENKNIREASNRIQFKLDEIELDSIKNSHRSYERDEKKQK